MAKMNISDRQTNIFKCRVSSHSISIQIQQNIISKSQQTFNVVMPLMNLRILDII